MSDVFISYSREDTDFVRHLHDALRSRGKSPWVDWQGIDYSTKWWEEICTGIEQADNFVFVITPHSLDSEYCHREIDHARRHNKRIITLMHREPEEAVTVGRWYKRDWESLARSNWEHLGSIQYLLFRNTDDFDTALNDLMTTIDKDPEHVAMHTSLLVRATEWNNKARTPSVLLRGEELQQAERWLDEADETGKAPFPTDTQREYIVASHKEEHRLAAEEAAQQARINQLQRETERRKQATRMIVSIGIIAILGVAAVAAVRIRSANAEVSSAEATRVAVDTQVAVAIGQANAASTREANANLRLTPIPPTLTQAAEIVSEARIEQQIAREFTLAITHLDSPAESILRMDNLVEQMSERGDVYRLRGLVYYEQGDYEAALDDFNRALEKNPDDTFAYINRGNIYRIFGELEDAINEYNRALSLNSESALAYYNRGLVHFDLQAYDQAIDDYTTAIDLDPNHALAYYGRGLVHYARQDYDKAIADVSMMIEIFPNDPRAFWSRGIAYYNRGNYAETIADFREYERINGELEDFMIEAIEVAEARLAQATATPPP